VKRRNRRSRADIRGAELALPRWWPTWIGLAALWSMAHLPLRLQRAIGRALGVVLYRLAASRRRVTRANLRLCFPELDAGAREGIARHSFAGLGESLFEMAFAWWGSAARLRALGRFRGREYLDEARARGRGVILLQGHFLCTDIAGQILGMEVPFTATYAPPRNPVMRAMTERLRGRFVARQIHHADVRRIVRALRDNEVVWHGPDQGAKRGKGIEARFFGQPAATNTATAKLARITGAAVVPYHPVRLPDGTYELRFEPALADFPGDDLAAATQRVNDVLEAHVRAAPAQYLWAHKRFRPRDGGPNPYRR